jgi:hypothetical protein
MEDQATWRTETRQYERIMVSRYVYLAENNEYVMRKRGEAIFHSFGLKSTGENLSITSVGIIEWPDGKLELVPIDLIRFIEPHKGG